MRFSNISLGHRKRTRAPPSPSKFGEDTFVLIEDEVSWSVHTYQCAYVCSGSFGFVKKGMGWVCTM